MVQTLLALYSLRGNQCDATEVVLRTLAAMVSEACSDSILSGRFTAWPEDARLWRQHEGCKRIRIEEDCRNFIATDSVVHKLAKSGRAMARAMRDGMSVSAVAKADETTMSRYRATSQREMSSAIGGTFAMSSDGIRSGDPAEETLVLVLWNAKSDNAVVLPPEACRASRTNQGGSRPSLDWGMREITVRLMFQEGAYAIYSHVALGFPDYRTDPAEGSHTRMAHSQSSISGVGPVSLPNCKLQPVGSSILIMSSTHTQTQFTNRTLQHSTADFANCNPTARPCANYKW